MKLESLRIKRFKSLYDVSLDFSRFRVLTGPNGSGKSNLVDAIGFLGEVYRFGTEYAVGRSGGIDSIAFRATRRTTIGVQFLVKASLSLSEVPRFTGRRNGPQDSDYEFRIEHSFTIKPASGKSTSDYALTEESFTVFLDSGDTLLKILQISTEAHADTRIYMVESHEVNPAIREICKNALGFFWRERERGSQEELFSVPGMQSGSGLDDIAVPIPVFREFRRRMSFIQAYRLNPAACRNPGALTPNASLESDGGNLPAVVARTALRQKEVWLKVMSGMRHIMSNLENISTEPSPDSGGLVLKFHETGSGRPWSAREVSDGTIQALALLLALHDRRGPIVLIEEPENAVHPWVLRRFLEECRQVEDRQVVLTTHSPILLKLLRPEEVVLLWRAGGRSHIKPLIKALPDSKDLYYEKGFDVFDLYDSGLIPQTLPGSDVEG
ncbi:AAA family ATPase [Streptomyces sp. ADMS]|uniref:AAA family ATPase n=1 Tax=Streptomyces sp. ADMS TaxID=3071415 RepID=UPI00296E43E6|nr:AAA family ATPase [Streptomyces sp. ADMS]MDW4908743.1 AAA family ATPase [Streptomyces sp. ADMS]